MILTLPHSNHLFEELYNPICFVEDEIHVTNNMDPDITVDFLKSTYGKDVKIRYIEKIKECPLCGEELSCNGTEPFNLNKKHHIKRQKYYCKNKKHKYYFVTRMDEFIPKGCNYTYKIQVGGLNIDVIDYSSYEKKSELINHHLKINIPRQTTYYHMRKLSEKYLIMKEKEIDEMLKTLNIEPTGVYHYDEQVVWVDGEMYFRMTLLDSGTNMVISDIIIFHEKFTKETIESFLKDSLNDLPLDAIITDGHNSYPLIIDALGAIHQKCVFHKMQNLMKPVYKRLRALKRIMKNNENKIDTLKGKEQNLKDEIGSKKGRISEKDKKRKKLKEKKESVKTEIKRTMVKIREVKEEIKELEMNVERISKIFKSETVTSG